MCSSASPCRPKVRLAAASLASSASSSLAWLGLTRVGTRSAAASDAARGIGRLASERAQQYRWLLLRSVCRAEAGAAVALLGHAASSPLIGDRR